MSQPWEREFKTSGNGLKGSLGFRVKRKVKTGIYALGLVMFCYMAVAKHAIKARKTVK